MQENRLFLNTEVDYCAHFQLKFGGSRSKTTTKAFLAVFICFVTKPVFLPN